MSTSSTPSDKQKVLVKNANNFFKMLNEESCENIRIKFWVGLEEQIKVSGLDDEVVVQVIFDEILNKNYDILSNKNLVYSITTFLRTKSAKSCEHFHDKFLTLVYNFLQNYEENKPLFHEYLAELVMNFYFSAELSESSENTLTPEIQKKVKNFFASLIEFDLDLFSFLIKNSFEFANDHWKIYFKSSEFNQILLFLIDRTILQGNFNLNFYYLEIIEHSLTNSKETVNNSNRGIFVNFISEIFHKVIESKFLENFDLKVQSENQNYILLLCKLVKISQSLFPLLDIANNSSLFLSYENFYLFILENVEITKKFNFSLIQLLMKIYESGNFTKFNRIFIPLLYSFCDEIYDFSSFKLFTTFLGNLNPDNQNSLLEKVFVKIILKSLTLNEKFRYGIKHDSLTAVVNSDKNSFKIEKQFMKNKHQFTNTIFFSYSAEINFLNYIVENCFSFSNIFYETNFIQNLKVLFSLNLEKFDIKFQNLLINFIFKLLLTYYDEIYIKTNTSPNFELFEVVFLNLDKISDKMFIKTEIYPLVISFIQGIILPNFNSHFSQNFRIPDLFFGFLFELSRQDSFANLTSKLLTSLFNMKSDSTLSLSKSNKIYALEKFVELVIRTNSAKFFTQFYNFSLDAMKKDSSESTFNLIHFGLWRYSEKYEGVLQNSLLDYILPKFEKFLENASNNNLVLHFETFFTLNSIYYILLKDEPVKLVSKLTDCFYNMRILKIIDKMFSQLKNGEVLNTIFEDDNEPAQMSLKDTLKLENLLKLGKLTNSHLTLATLLSLSQIYSLFIARTIKSNKETFNVKNFSDPNNKVIVSLLKSFDYISNALLFADGEKSISHLIFLNEFFTQDENVNFFYNTHSYVSAMNHIEKENMDYSQLHEVNTTIIKEKNKHLTEYLLLNPNSIFLMKNLIQAVFSYEFSILHLMDSKKNLNLGGSNKIFVLENLFDNSSLSNLVRNDQISLLNQNKDLQSFFIKFFLEVLYKTEEKDKQLNENLFYFLLSNNLLMKYFRSGNHDLLNFDLILINFYPIVKMNKHTPESDDLLKNFLNFLFYFSKLYKNVFNFSLRLVLNKTIFHNILLMNNKNIGPELFTLIEFLISQIIFYSSYKNESSEYITDIIKNVSNSIRFNIGEEDNYEINFHNLTLYGKLIESTLSSFHVKTDDHHKVEINKKFKDNIIQLINSDFLAIYFEHVFISPFKNETSIKQLNSNLNIYFDNLDIVLTISSSRNLLENPKIGSIFKENILAQNVLLFQEISLSKRLYQFMKYYCKLIRDVESGSTGQLTSEYVGILENYILHHLISKKNEKLMFDMTKNLLLNKEFISDPEFYLKFEELFRLTSMVILQIIYEKEDNSGNNVQQNNKQMNNKVQPHSTNLKIMANTNEVMKNIGTYMIIRIFKRSGMGNALLNSIDNNYINLQENQQFKELLWTLKN